MRDAGLIRSAVRPAAHVPVAAIHRGGVVTLTDGSAARVLELTPRPPSGPGESEHESLLEQLTGFLERLAPGEALQWYTEARPVPRSRLLGGDDDDLDVGGDVEPLRLLAEEDRRSLRLQMGDPATVERGTYLVLREPMSRRRPRGAEHGRLHRRLLVRTDRARAMLDSLDLRPRPLDGPGISRLLLRRMHSAADPPVERRVEIVGSLDPARDLEQARAVAVQLLDHLRGAAVDFSDERIVRIGGDLEQTIYLGGQLGDMRFDWLDAMLSVEQPFVLIVHARAREDAELDVGVYQTVREPGPDADPVRLATAVDAVVRDSAAAASARVDRGEFVQAALWRSTLPLGLDKAAIGHRVSARTTAASLPVAVEGCGSPAGIPLAHGPRGTVERLDPWDPDHEHAAIVVAGTGEARTAAALAIVARLVTSGANAVVADLDGDLAAQCARLGSAARVVRAGSPADVLEAERAPLTVLDAASAPDVVPVTAAAAALLPGGGTRNGPTVLAVAGADRLAGEPAGAGWLRDGAIRARRDGACVIVIAESLLPIARAGLLPVLPVRLLLRHSEADVAQLADSLRLSRTEASLLAHLEEHAGAALWLNGARGRTPVRVIPLPDPLPAS